MQRANGARPTPGLPPGIDRYPYGRPDRGIEQGTSQISIVDARGNIASYTSSVETIFGSRHLVGGMVMNNQLTDFAFKPSLGDKPVANRRLPGRRPMSSMAPTLVFRNGEPVLALGAPAAAAFPIYSAGCCWRPWSGTNRRRGRWAFPISHAGAQRWCWKRIPRCTGPFRCSSSQAR